MMHRRRRRLAGLSAAALFALAHVDGTAVASRPSQLADVSTVRGVVVDPGGHPVAGARVLLESDSHQYAALSDRDGSVVLRAVVPDTYMASATKAGFLPGAYGQTRLAGTAEPVELRAGEVFDLKIALWPAGSIEGTVRDERSDPMVGVEVDLLQMRAMNGEAHLAAAGRAVTDDRGQYRFGALGPGDYSLLIPNAITTFSSSVFGSRIGYATPEAMTAGGSQIKGSASGAVVDSSGKLLLHPTVMYPGTSGSGAAATLRLGAGENVSADVSVPQVPGHDISGLLTGPGGPAALAVIRLVPQVLYDRVDSRLFQCATTASGNDGTFRFVGVPEGDYVLDVVIPPAGRKTSEGMGVEMALVQLEHPASSDDPYGTQRPLPPSGPTLWASEQVSVRDKNVQLQVVLQPGGGAAGRLIFDGVREPPGAEEIDKILVTLEGAVGTFTSVPPGPVAHDLTFHTYGVPAGQYRITVRNLPSGWGLTSAQYNGLDISDTPVQFGSSDITGVAISFSDRPARLSGTVRDASGAPVSNAFVLAFRAAAEQDVWMPITHIGHAKTGRYGTYHIDGLPADRYYIVALDHEPDEWRTPDVLRTLAARAARVRVTLAADVTQDLTVSK